MFVKEIYLSNEARSTIRNRINRNRGKGGQNQFICRVGYVFKSRWFLASLIWNGGTLRKKTFEVSAYTVTKNVNWTPKS